ncbi:hypothetical protein COU60_05380 [Candidatus Pacearchaeota archaeon CG10_big_fil_rev_8_21_14_0_10_34_76]|nr:MAG: hypothetical protein COU60_05380 [Candidatus Pacearchaeota archaeon CG10_big_fil_rev_8_21_14_0_10_34_76]
MVGQIELQELNSLVIQARHNFENNQIEFNLLKKLYIQYNSIKGIDRFLKDAQSLFPKLNCGVTSVYLRHLLKKGDVIKGYYKGHKHTFLKVDDKIIDITSDQYGGPKIYIGPLVPPWKIKS